MCYSLWCSFLSAGDALLKSATRTLLEFNTTADCDGGGRARHKLQSSIAFLCGKTLVSPRRPRPPAAAPGHGRKEPRAQQIDPQPKSPSPLRANK